VVERDDAVGDALDDLQVVLGHEDRVAALGAQRPEGLTAAAMQGGGPMTPRRRSPDRAGRLRAGERLERGRRVEYWLDSAGVVRSPTGDDDLETVPLFGAARGCEPFEQRRLRFTGACGERLDDGRDEVLYVLGGRGAATIGRELFDLGPGAAAFVARGTPWRVEESDGLELLSVLVREPLPAGTTHAVVRAGARAGATAGRQFTLLSTPETGCASVTQFVGYIPPGRAPDHFHRYDEVLYVLDGDGALHIEGESAPLHSGACVHLPARLVHCLENTGAGEMAVLGVFRPAGSPAEAYYPDGTPAAVHLEEN
jgi:mannose-6-phosphate isomerase-like protein (cupin superfamily)